MRLNNIKTEEKKIDFKGLYNRLSDDDQKLLLLLEKKTLPDMEEIASKNKSTLIDNFFEHIDAIRQISTKMGIMYMTKGVENTILTPLIKEALKIGHSIRKNEGKVNINCKDYDQELVEVFVVTEPI